MFICAAGDIHGAMDRLYADVLAFEASLEIRFDWILHVGDFGIWPDPERIDKAARKHDGAGDFSIWLEAGRVAPRRTLFIKGNHEDFLWLDAQKSPEVLPNLFYLRNGSTIDIEAAGLDIALARLHPRVCFFGHHHTRVTTEIAGVRCIGLNIVARPGNLIAIDISQQKLPWSLLGEWPLH